MKNIYSRFLLITAIFISVVSVNAQMLDEVKTRQRYGGTKDDLLENITKCSNEDMLMIGSSSSSNLDLPNNFGMSDGWITRTTRLGKVIWSRNYGGSLNDFLTSAVESTDGSILVCGSSSSTNGDISNHYGSSDVWVMKLSPAGNIVWSKCFGGTLDDQAFNITRTTNGKYIIVGTSASANNNIPNNYGQTDIWILMIDENGNLMWQKNVGGSLMDYAWSATAVNNGVLFCGGSYSSNYDITALKGAEDIVVGKIDTLGQLAWVKTYGGTNEEEALDITTNYMGEIFVTGKVNSPDGDFSNIKGDWDAFILKLDQNGSIVWSKTYGGPAADIGHSIQTDMTNSAYVGGSSLSATGDLIVNAGMEDAWVFKVDQNATLINWQREMGGSNIDITKRIKVLNNALYIAGNTSSLAFENMLTKGQSDAFLMRLQCTVGKLYSSAGNDTICNGTSVTLIDSTLNVANRSWYINNNFLRSDSSFSYSFNQTGLNVIKLVTSKNGCVADTIYRNFYVKDAPFVDLGADLTVCRNNPLILFAGTSAAPNCNYTWSTNQTGVQIPFDTKTHNSGYYSVTVTDTITKCASTDSVFVTVNFIAEVNLGTDISKCKTDSVQLFAGTYPNSRYNWSKGDTTSTIWVNNPGQYIVTVTNMSMGCWDADTINVNSTNDPTIDLGANTVFVCEGDTITLDLSPLGAATYFWDPTGETTASIKLTNSGIYSVTATFSDGCKDMDTVEYYFNPKPTIVVDSVINPKCFGDQTGRIITSVSDVAPPVSYSWTGRSDTTSFLNNIPAGTYTLNIIDGNACRNDKQIIVTQNPLLQLLLQGQKDVTCFNDANGEVYFNPTGGVIPFNIDYNGTSLSSDTLKNLYPGNLQLILTDGANCKDTLNVTIKGPASQLAIDSAVVKKISCNATNDGNIFIFPSGGLPPYKYSIDNGATYVNNRLFTNLGAGNYIVRIKDSLNCTINGDTIDLTVPAFISFNLGNDTTICANDTISLNANVNGASYLWSTGEQTQSIRVSSNGSYSVTVSTTECSIADTINVSIDLIDVVIDSIQHAKCFGSFDGAIYTSTTSSTGVTYVWSNFSNSDDITSIGAGTYTLTVSNTRNCKTLLSAEINEPTDISINIDSIRWVKCFGGSDGAIFITATGGTGAYTYSWNNDVASTKDLINFPTGNYRITVKDSNNCTKNNIAFITEPPELEVSFDSVHNASVCGIADGEIFTCVKGGVLPYTYQWSDPQYQNEDLQGLTAKNYSLTVTDINNCKASRMTTVDENYCHLIVIPAFADSKLCDTNTYVMLSPLQIYEEADTSGGFGADMQNAVLKLKMEGGFEINADSVRLYYGAGRNDISNASLSIDYDTIKITLNTTSLHSKRDTLIISNLWVRSRSWDQSGISGIIKYDPGSTASLNGIPDTTILGSVCLSPLTYIKSIDYVLVDSAKMLQGSLKNPILGINIQIEGVCGDTLKLQEIDFNTTGSDNPVKDINLSRVYASNNIPFFSPVQMFALQDGHQASFEFKGANSYILKEGNNFFWLAYDVDTTATLNNYLSAECTKIVINENEYTPNPSSISKRMISEGENFNTSYSGYWHDPNTWGGKAAWVPDEDDNVTISGGSVITLGANASCVNLNIIDGELRLGSYQLTIRGNLTGAEKDNIVSTSSSKLVINDVGDKDIFEMPASIQKLQKLTLNRTNGASSNHDLDLDDNVPADSNVLVLQNGILSMTGTSKLLLNSKAIKKNISCSDASYVDGNVSRNIKKNSGFYIFPIGNANFSRRFGVATQSGNDDNLNEVKFIYDEPVNIGHVNYTFLPGGIYQYYYWEHTFSGGNPQRRIYYEDSDFPGLTSEEKIASLTLSNNDASTPSDEWSKATTPRTVFDGAGEKYVQFDNANASNSRYWTFGSISKSIEEIVMPIELLSFTAKAQDQTTLLEWITSSETNNSYFTLERSTDMTNFAPIASIPGAGTSNEIIYYSHTDEAPVTGTNYYRLKQTDYNGDFSYSNIISVSFESNEQVRFYPNPIHETLNIELFSLTADKVSIEIFNLRGELIFNESLDLVKGTNIFKYPTLGLKDNSFIVKIKSNSNQINPVKKVIVKM